MSFKLMADSQTITAAVPGQPLGTTPTNLQGVQLRLYVVHRLSASSALVVFSLYTEPSIDNSKISTIAAMNGISANGFTAGGVTVSGVSLVDPAGLKQYLPYMSKPTDDGTCVCSFFPNDVSLFTPGQSSYFAAVTAAPPPGVSAVSFVTGLGTIGNVDISG